MSTDTRQVARTRHVLAGLRPQPLSSYLAGIGLIRLLGEQADEGATAAWTPDGLVIDTIVADLATWLASEYMPTPVLSPWNNGSGFGPKDKEPKRTLDALQAHPSPRLAPFRAAIPVAADLSSRARANGWLTGGGKGGDKRRVVQEFRNLCPDALVPWIDAVVVLAGDDTFFPPLLGTGGNDGRLDFSTNFHQRLLDVLDPTNKGQDRSLEAARDLLSGTEIQRLANAAVGQFDPGAAGGPGSSRFGAADSLVNSWGFVLLVEGALLFAASAVRRYQHDSGRAAIPFTVYASPDGSASGADGEESRGEIWVPVWKQDLTLAEVRQLFGEARASWRGRPARRAVEFYAATRTLGVARGIDEFIRYGLQRRNGLAFTAVPVDRVNVTDRPEVRLAADIEDWVSWARGADSSAAVSQAVRHFDVHYLEYARDGGAAPLARLLAALTALEQAVGRSGRARGKVPVRRPPAAQAFLDVLATKHCAELRVAVGIASCATQPGAGLARTSARSMRQILLPVDPPDPADRASRTHRDGRWREAPVVPGFGVRPLPRVLADVLAWRCRTAAAETGQEAFRGVPTFRYGVPVPAADLHAFAAGLLDDEALALLLRACLALDWRTVRCDWSARYPVTPVPTLGLLQPLARGLAPRLAGQRPAPTGQRPASRPTDREVPRLALSPDWANRLVAGQVRAVHEEAAARLRQAGWQAVPAPPMPASGVLVAAALVPRCRDRDAAAVLRRLTTRLRTEADDAQPSLAEPSGIPESAGFPESAGSIESTESPYLTEELS